MRKSNKRLLKIEEKKRDVLNSKPRNMRSYEKKYDSADISKHSDGYHANLKMFTPLKNGGYALKETKMIIDTHDKKEAISVVKKMHKQKSIKTGCKNKKIN